MSHDSGHSRHKGDVVVKVVGPSTREAAALRLLAGPQTVPVLHDDEDTLIIPALHPGDELASVPSDRERTDVFVDVLGALPSVAEPSGMPSFADVLAAVFQRVDARSLGQDFHEQVDEANSCLRSLQAKYDSVVLHGDLHHHNILRSKDSWCVIDPHGYFGPRVLEVGAFLKNPIGFLATDDWREVLAARIEQLSGAMEISECDICTAAFVYGVVSAGWSLEDDGDVDSEFLAYLNFLAERISP